MAFKKFVFRCALDGLDMSRFNFDTARQVSHSGGVERTLEVISSLLKRNSISCWKGASARPRRSCEVRCRERPVVILFLKIFRLVLVTVVRKGKYHPL
jgi:hypothetical protein